MDAVRFLVFKWRLIRLNRKLARRPWFRDLLALRAKEVNVNLSPLTGPIGSILVLLALVAPLFWIAYRVPWPPLRDIYQSSGLSWWATYEPLVVIVWCLYVTTEFVNWAWRNVGFSRIRTLLVEASSTREKAFELAAVWERGRSNGRFLEGLFDQYEEDRQHLTNHLGVTVSVVRDRRSPENAPVNAGSWVIPTTVPLQELLHVHDPYEVGSRVTSQVEATLPRYAAMFRSNGRTKFLAQWRQARKSQSRKATKRELKDLSSDELERACELQESGKNYVLRRLSTSDGGLRIDVGRADYGQIVRSCDYLIEEAFLASGVCAGEAHQKPLHIGGRWLMRTMPARWHLKGLQPDELIVESKRRAPGIGLAAVVVSRGTGSGAYQVIYKKRSFSVGTYPGMLHVVPTGMFNAKSKSEDKAPDLRKHPGRVLFTEFLEECKDLRSLGGFADDANWQRLLEGNLTWWAWDPEDFDKGSVLEGTQSAEAIKRVEARLLALKQGKGAPKFTLQDFGVFVTGVAFDLLSLRPEVCFAIDLPSELLGEVRPNDEATEIMIFPRDDLQELGRVNPPEEWVRSGYAAFCLAVDNLDQGTLESCPRSSAADFIPKVQETPVYEDSIRSAHP